MPDLASKARCRGARRRASREETLQSVEEKTRGFADRGRSGRRRLGAASSERGDGGRGKARRRAWRASVHRQRARPRARFALHTIARFTAGRARKASEKRAGDLWTIEGDARGGTGGERRGKRDRRGRGNQGRRRKGVGERQGRSFERGPWRASTIEWRWHKGGKTNEWAGVGGSPCDPGKASVGGREGERGAGGGAGARLGGEIERKSARWGAERKIGAKGREK